MRIAFIVNRFPVLSETFILNQITGLIERGHQVDIYAKGPSSEKKIQPDVMRYNLLESTYYWHLRAYPLFSLMRRVWLAFITCLKQPKIVRQAFNMSRYDTLLSALNQLFCAAAYVPLGEREYDIIHCQFGICGILGMYLKDIGLLKGKLVVSFRGFDISKGIQKLGNGIYRQLFDAGDLFLPNCEYFKRRLIDLGCDKRKIVVHHSGINCEKFPLRNYQTFTNDTVKILTVARLIEKKGIKYAIHAVAKIIQLKRSVMYTVVGDGPLRTRLTRLARKLRIAGAVRFLGVTSSDEIITLLQNCDMVLAPSVTARDGNQEGIPVVLMEAMAMGIPVVSTMHSGIPELVEDGGSGFLAPEKDVNALAERLTYLIKHPEHWSAMGVVGRAAIEQRHDINKLNNRLVKLYKSLTLS